MVRDIDVAYTEMGAGDAVVMIHGLAEDRHTWSNQQALLSGFRTYAYDLRGHGDTTIGVPDATLAQLGDDLVGFLEAVSGPAVVIGFSLGGTVALWAAAHRPDLVKRAVVLGTSSVVGRSAVSFYGERIAMAADTRRPAFASALRDDTAAGLAVASEQLDEVVPRRLAAVGDGAGYRNAAQAMASLHQEPLTPLLARVSVHVDVVGATEDTFCPRRAAQIILDALSDGHYHEIPDAGHLMNIDNPGAVTEVLRATLGEMY